MGSIRSPLWRHGGTVHGPQPRSYEYKLPRKMGLGALRSALSAKVQAFAIPDHKTKNFQRVLGALQTKKTVLLVETGENANLQRASQNLQGVKLVASKDVNVYDLLKYQEVLLTETAARKLSEGLA